MSASWRPDFFNQMDVGIGPLRCESDPRPQITSDTQQASGTHSPHVVADGEAGDPIANVVVGSSGTFLAIQVVDESTQVMFDPSDQAMYGSGSPTQPGLLG